MIDRAESLIVDAAALKRLGRYQLEAALQSAHVARRRGSASGWNDIVSIYDALAMLVPSPVVTINRAVAIAHRDGAAAGLAALDVLATDARVHDYQPYWAARADLLARAGQGADAAEAYRRAIDLEADPAVRAFLEARRARIAH
jgi:RNA polymerase sigma-70 factor (ECF subfamily)